jgi:SMI1 / KNR4 family (SUKH-1)
MILNRTNGGGASEETIKQCQLYFNHKLPMDYVSFLRTYDGCTLFKVDDVAGFRFWGCEELIQQNKFHKNNVGADWDDRVILVCACLGDGDYIGIKVIDDQSYCILDCFGEEIPARWTVIGNSFSHFIATLIDQKGRKFWL